MSEATNQLVDKVKAAGRKPLSLSAGVLLTTALAVSVLFHESPGKASVPTPLDDNSVAALTALDRAVESVAARVEPAVVNVQVTSKGSEEETSIAAAGVGQQGQDQQLPPGFAQFFGPNGPFGGSGQPGQGQGQGRRPRSGTPLPAAAAAAGAWHRQRHHHLAGWLHRHQQPRGRRRGECEGHPERPARDRRQGDRRGQAQPTSR
jgi:S1-C subfamily serine protease